MKQVKSSDIEAIKLIFNSYPAKEQLISMQCAKYELTQEFVNEFKNHITKKAFSSSPNLSAGLIERNADLFDIEIWLDNENKDIKVLEDERFIEKYGEETVGKALAKINYKNITKGIFDRFEDKLSLDTKKLVINNSNLSNDEEFLMNNLKYLDENIFKNRTLEVEWSNALIENIFKNKQLTVRFVLNALQNNKDLAFIKRMLTSEFDYINTGGTFDTDLKNFINKLSENYIGDLFNLIRKHAKNAFTYAILNHTLTMKDYLEEDFLSENADLFINEGMKVDLANYARKRDYNSILIMLKLS